MKRYTDFDVDTLTLHCIDEDVVHVDWDSYPLKRVAAVYDVRRAMHDKVIPSVLYRRRFAGHGLHMTVWVELGRQFRRAVVHEYGGGDIWGIEYDLAQWMESELARHGDTYRWPGAEVATGDKTGAEETR